MAATPEVQEGLRFQNWSHLTYTFGDDGLAQVARARVLLLAGEGDLGPVELLPALRALLRSLGTVGVCSVGASGPIALEELEAFHVGVASRCPTQDCAEKHGQDDLPTTFHLNDLDDALSQEVISKFACVIYIKPNYKKAVEIGSLCRSCRVPFIWACQQGPLLSVFVDPGKSDVAVNPQGFCRNDSQAVKVGHVTKDSLLHAVTCIGGHGLFTGDLVSLCDQLYRAEVVSDTEFHALQVDADVEDSLATWDEAKATTVTLVRRNNEPEAVEYLDLPASVWKPNFDHGCVDGKNSLEKHIAFMSKVKMDNSIDELITKLGCKNPSKEYIYGVADRMFYLRTSNEVAYGLFAGVVSSQVLNLITKRFRPLCQWMHFDLPINYTRTKASRFGFVKHNVLLNGLTPLGIRIFERLISCSDFVGKIIVAGDDVLSKSLLFNTSHEVFSAKDLDRPVWDVLTEYAKKKSGAVDIVLEHKPDNTAENEKEHFGNEFFEKVDMMVSAGGSWDVRRNVGCQSVQHSKSLIDAGAHNFLGHVQSVIPHVTESYNCSNDPPDVEYPYCVVKSFPYSADHAIAWAVAKVENITQNKPKTYTAFWTEGGEDVSTRVKNGDLPDNAVLVKKFLGNLCSTWQECVAVARNKFQKYFHHKALQLLSIFPNEADDKEKFWSFPKSAPKPVVFDPNTRLHLQFVRELALVWATLMRIQVSEDELKDDHLQSIIVKVKVPEFVAKNKNIVTDESVSKSEVNSSVITGDIDLNSFSKELLSVKQKNLAYESVPAKSIENLLVYSSQLRCQMYDIPTPDVPTIMRVSGQICPCPDPLVDVLADLVILELRRLSESLQVHIKKHSPTDWWVSLAPLYLMPATPRSVSNMSGMKLTLWDKLEVRGKSDWTLQDFLLDLEEKYSIMATMVVQGTKMVFVEIMPSHRPRRDKLMSSLVKKDPNCPFVLLSITAAAKIPTDEDISAPPVKYYL